MFDREYEASNAKPGFGAPTTVAGQSANRAFRRANRGNLCDNVPAQFSRDYSSRRPSPTAQARPFSQTTDRPNRARSGSYFDPSEQDQSRDPQFRQGVRPTRYRPPPPRGPSSRLARDI